MRLDEDLKPLIPSVSAKDAGFMDGWKGLPANPPRERRAAHYYEIGYVEGSECRQRFLGIRK